MTSNLTADFANSSEDQAGLLDELSVWAAPFGLKLLDHINYRKGITALDIGSGTGFPLTEVAMRLGDTCKVYGIDPWKAAVTRTRKKIAYYGIRNAEMIAGVAEHLPLGDRSVDLIISNNGLNNVSDLEKSLAECSRVIKPDGQFIQTVNQNKTMTEFYTVMEKVLSDLGLSQCIQAMQAHIDKKRMPLGDYTSMLEKHGFTFEAVVYDQFEYTFVDGTSMLKHFFIRFAFMDGWKGFIPSEKQKEVFRNIEEEMNRQSMEKPLKLSVPFVVINCKK